MILLSQESFSALFQLLYPESPFSRFMIFKVTNRSARRILVWVKRIFLFDLLRRYIRYLQCKHTFFMRYSYFSWRFKQNNWAFNDISKILGTIHNQISLAPEAWWMHKVCCQAVANKFTMVTWTCENFKLNATRHGMLGGIWVIWWEDFRKILGFKTFGLLRDWKMR